MNFNNNLLNQTHMQNYNNMNVFNKFNQIIKKYLNNQIVIKFINRIYDKKIDQWIIKSLYLRLK